MKLTVLSSPSSTILCGDCLSGFLGATVALSCKAKSSSCEQSSTNCLHQTRDLGGSQQFQRHHAECGSLSGFLGRGTVALSCNVELGKHFQADALSLDASLFSMPLVSTKAHSLDVVGSFRHLQAG